MSTKTRSLACDLTPAELQDKCSQLSAKLSEIDEAKTRLSYETKRMKEALDEIQGQASALAREIRTKSEQRDVEIAEERDMDKKTLKTIRIDTGAIIGERPLMPIELQHELPLGGAKEVTSVTIDANTAINLKEAAARMKGKKSKAKEDERPQEWWEKEP
jgi:hypothetical protein